MIVDKRRRDLILIYASTNRRSQDNLDYIYIYIDHYTRLTLRCIDCIRNVLRLYENIMLLESTNTKHISLIFIK